MPTIKHIFMRIFICTILCVSVIPHLNIMYQLIQMIVISHMLLLASRPSPLVVPLSIKGTCHTFLNMCCQDLKTLALLHTNTFYQYNVSYRRSSARECMHVCRLILQSILCPNLVQVSMSLSEFRPKISLVSVPVAILWKKSSLYLSFHLG